MPTVNLNNSLNQSRVTVKLAPPQVLTPSQRINFSASISPSKVSQNNQSLMEPNPCDTQTVLAALKGNRKRVRKEKDNAIENEVKRRRQQETDSESSDSSIVITTNSAQNMDTNGDILMKTLQGKRPATPLVFYESPSIQCSSKRHKNDILTVSYSSSKKFFKEDALLILPNKKRQVTNFSPPSNKVSKTKDCDLSEDDVIDLTENDGKEKEVDLNKQLNEVVEESDQSEEALVVAPIRIEGQSHKRNLDCYAKLGKLNANVYNVPQYLPTLSDCEEHKKIEEDRVRRLLGTPLKKSVPSVSSETIALPLFQPITSFSSSIPSTSDSTKETLISKPEATLPSLNTASFTSNSFGFGKPTIVTPMLETSLTTTLVTQSSGSFLATGLDTKTSEPSLVINDNVNNASKRDFLSKTNDAAIKESKSTQSDKGNAFLNCFLANVGREPIPISTSSVISSGSPTSFTEAFKFSSSNPSLTTNVVATPLATTSPSGSNSSITAKPFATDIMTGSSFAKPIHSQLNDTYGSQLNQDIGALVPKSSTGITTSTITTSSLGFASPDTVLSFGSSSNSPSVSLTQPITVTANENQEKTLEAKTASSGLLPFSTASNLPKTIQFANTVPSQAATTNLLSNVVSNPQFSVTTSTPYQLPSNPTTQQATTSVTTPMFQVSNSKTAQPTSTTNSTPSLFKFLSQPSEAPTSTATTGTSLFSFGTKANETPNSSVPNTASLQPGIFSVKNPAFGSGGPLPSYSEATSTSLGQTNTQAIPSTGSFGSVLPLSTQSFSFGTQQTSTVSSPFTNPPPAYSSGFGSSTSSQNNTFGSTPSSVNQLNFGAAANTVTSVFGLNDPSKNSTTNFSFGSANQPNAYGSTPSLANAFGTSQTLTNAFGSAQTSTNAFGSNQPSTNAFGTSHPSTNAFGTSQPSTNSFGNSQPSTNAFGTAQPLTNAFGSTQPSSNAFGSTQPLTNAFGSTQPSTNAFGSTQPSTNAFGNPQTSTSAFGSIQPANNAFGTSQPSTNAFGSSQPLTNTFGSSQTTTNAFGNSQPVSNAFGSTQPSVNTFGSSLLPSSTAFGSTKPSSTAFGGTQPSSTAFGSSQSSSTSFGSTQPSVTAFQFNVASKNFNFGSTPTPEQPAFGTSQPLPQPYVFGGGQPTVPAADPNAVPGSQLFSIGSGVRDKRVGASRRRPRK